MSAAKALLSYHYLKLGRLGRGEVVNLFLKDAGIDVETRLYPYDESWPAQSEALKKQGITRTGKLPAIEYNGKILSQHIPILRFFAREVGDYDGETNWDKYVVDAVADIYNDWRTNWVTNLRAKSAEYKDKYTPNYYKLVSQYYSASNGPYLLGDKITYVDFAVYQSIDNDRRTGSLPSDLPPTIVALEAAMESRPRIAEYIKNNK